MATDILIVDDEADIREIVAGILQDEGHGDAHRRRQRQRAGGDRRTPARAWSSSTSGCRAAASTACRCSTRSTRSIRTLPVVMISGHGNIETAVSAIKRGAYDYIEKPFKADRLVLVAERALEAYKLRREIAELRQRSGDSEELIGASGRDEPSPPDDRARRADKQPRHDLRPVRRRQGAGRAGDP